MLTSSMRVVPVNREASTVLSGGCGEGSVQGLWQHPASMVLNDFDSLDHCSQSEALSGWVEEQPPLPLQCRQAVAPQSCGGGQV